MRKPLRVLLCALGGLAAGAGLAGYKFPGYLHASVALNGPEKPLVVDGRRRQFLALSVTGLGEVRDLRVRMAGAEVGSWFPPAVRVSWPWGKAPSFESGRFGGFPAGRKLPVYLGFDHDGPQAIEFVDGASGKVIRTVKITRGGTDGGHQH